MFPGSKRKKPLIIPLIICGGSGTRLWPASRERRPKQFLALFEKLSMFQQTVRRVMDPALFGAPVVITNGQYGSLVAAQLDELDIRADILLEPEARDSGPAILAGALFIAQKSGNDSVVLTLAADHMIRDVRAFQKTCRTALPAAQSGYIVTFGVTPDHPATGYGYIEAGRVIEPGVHAVTRFVEKPDAPTAARYVQQGYLWNSGNFLFQASALADAYGESDPATLTTMRDAVAKARADGREHRLDALAFARATKLSFDYAVMEKTTRAAVVPASYDWSDVGSWAAVRELSARDEAGNAARGEAVFAEAKDNFVSSDGPLVALVGVSDLAVVATDDAVLVARRDDSAGVKKLVEQLKTSHPSLTQGHGSANGLGHHLEPIDLAEGDRLTLQGPRDHAKHWLVTDGTARIAIDNQVRRLEKHESIHIPPGADCTLENSGPGALHILEIQLRSSS
jgi:mannose-1-phosphate guanylyltransferase/mannose-6-phosphate isomerase